MLQLSKVNQAVGKAASAALKGATIKRVESEPTVDSAGQEALRILIVIAEGSATAISGDSVVDTLVAIDRELRKSGEERLPIVEFATEQELQSIDDTES